MVRTGHYFAVTGFGTSIIIVFVFNGIGKAVRFLRGLYKKIIWCKNVTNKSKKPSQNVNLICWLVGLGRFVRGRRTVGLLRVRRWGWVGRFRINFEFRISWFRFVWLRSRPRSVSFRSWVSRLGRVWLGVGRLGRVWLGVGRLGRVWFRIGRLGRVRLRGRVARFGIRGRFRIFRFRVRSWFRIFGFRVRSRFRIFRFRVRSWFRILGFRIRSRLGIFRFRIRSRFRILGFSVRSGLGVSWLRIFGLGVRCRSRIRIRGWLPGVLRVRSRTRTGTRTVNGHFSFGIFGGGRLFFGDSRLFGGRLFTRCGQTRGDHQGQNKQNLHKTKEQL